MTKTKIEEKDLLKRIIEDDDQVAFRKFFDIHFSKVFRTVKSIVKNEDLGKELTSDVFYKFWKSRKKIKQGQSIEIYLYVIAKNCAFNQLKKDRSKYAMSIDDVIVEHGLCPETQYLQNELSITLKRTLNLLSPKCREVFCLIKKKGHSYQQAAEILCLSIKTIENHMIRANKFIKAHMGPYFLDSEFNH